MPLIKWNDSFRINIVEIDNQHRKIIAMINELHDAMSENRTEDVLGKIIDGLISYIPIHFSTEEKYFDKYKFPETITHKSEHDEFIVKVIDFKRGFKEERNKIEYEIMNFLKDWLVNHIKGSDKKFGSFLMQKDFTRSNSYLRSENKVKCRIEDDIVYVEGEGGHSFEELENEMNKIMNSGVNYIGFITQGNLLRGTDVRTLKKCAAHHLKYHPDFPNAGIIDNMALRFLANTYMKLTKEINTKLFANKTDAVDWIRNRNKK